MLCKPSVVITSVLATLAAATVVQRQDGGTSECNTGPIQCCNSVQNSTSEGVSELAGLLGLDLGSILGLVGLGCSPLDILGIGGGSGCAAQPVCCENNTFNGLISLGCTAIDLSL